MLCSTPPKNTPCGLLIVMCRGVKYRQLKGLHIASEGDQPGGAPWLVFTNFLEGEPMQKREISKYAVRVFVENGILSDDEIGQIDDVITDMDWETVICSQLEPQVSEKIRIEIAIEVGN